MDFDKDKNNKDFTGKKPQSSLIYDNPLSKGYKTDMHKLELKHKQIIKETSYMNKRNKVIKFSTRLFWISTITFTLWVASGFYDLFPRLKLDEKIQDYNEKQLKR